MNLLLPLPNRHFRRQDHQTTPILQVTSFFLQILGFHRFSTSDWILLSLDRHLLAAKVLWEICFSDLLTILDGMIQ